VQVLPSSGQKLRALIAVDRPLFAGSEAPPGNTGQGAVHGRFLPWFLRVHHFQSSLCTVLYRQQPNMCYLSPNDFSFVTVQSAGNPAGKFPLEGYGRKIGEGKALGPEHPRTTGTMMRYADILRLMKRKRESNQMKARARSAALNYAQQSFTGYTVDVTNLRR
jgi:hypothetical protein